MKNRTALALLSVVVALGAAGCSPVAPIRAVVPFWGAPQAPTPPPSGGTLPAEYVIGPEDVLTVVFWRDKDMSGDVIVRPDGMISLPVLNEIQAAGLTPSQVQKSILEKAANFFEDASATVVVKEIKSRKVFITGEVNKPGTYILSGPLSVMQLIALAGGLQEFADGGNIAVMRTDQGRQMAYRFNYDQVKERKNLAQNIDLMPGDTVIVP